MQRSFFIVALNLFLSTLIIHSTKAAAVPLLPSRLRSFEAQLHQAIQAVNQSICSCAVESATSGQVYPDCFSIQQGDDEHPCIPRIVHQTWKSTVIPREHLLAYHSWTHLNRNWLRLLWTDDDVHEWVALHYPWLLPTFDAYEFPVQRADVFRLLVLQTYGGVYADIDYELLQPLDKFVSSINRPLAFVSPGRWPTSISNSLMMSRRCPQLWDDLIHRLPEAAMASKSSWFPRSKVMSATGPTFLRNWYVSD